MGSTENVIKNKAQKANIQSGHLVIQTLIFFVPLAP